MGASGGVDRDDVRRFGLCGGCEHAETLDSRTGSRFLFCGRARRDPRYAKYPPVPVFACAGYAPRPARGATPEGEAPG